MVSTFGGVLPVCFARCPDHHEIYNMRVEKEHVPTGKHRERGAQFWGRPQDGHVFSVPIEACRSAQAVLLVSGGRCAVLAESLGRLGEEGSDFTYELACGTRRENKNDD